MPRVKGVFRRPREDYSLDIPQINENAQLIRKRAKTVMKEENGTRRYPIIYGEDFPIKMGGKIHAYDIRLGTPTLDFHSKPSKADGEKDETGDYGHTINSNPVYSKQHETFYEEDEVFERYRSDTVQTNHYELPVLSHVQHMGNLQGTNSNTPDNKSSQSDDQRDIPSLFNKTQPKVRRIPVLIRRRSKNRSHQDQTVHQKLPKTISPLKEIPSILIKHSKITEQTTENQLHTVDYTNIKERKFIQNKSSVTIKGASSQTNESFKISLHGTMPKKVSAEVSVQVGSKDKVSCDTQTQMDSDQEKRFKNKKVQVMLSVISTATGQERANKPTQTLGRRL